jgi:uncharacterized protein (DUF1330 family)
MLAGIGIGAFGVQTLHAQKRAPAYIVADNEITDLDNYMKEVAPVAERTTAAAGGRFLARGKPMSLSGDPAKGRLVIVQFENMEVAGGPQERRAVCEVSRHGNRGRGSVSSPSAARLRRPVLA